MADTDPTRRGIDSLDMHGATAGLPEQVESVLDASHDERAEQGVVDPSTTAEEAGPPDHGCGDGVQLEGPAAQGVGGGELARGLDDSCS